MSRRAFVCSLVAAAALGGSWLRPTDTSAELYEYLDEEGRVVYTTAAPPRAQTRVVFRERAGPRPTARARASSALPSERPSPGLAFRREARDFAPERYRRYDAHLLDAARLYQLPVALLRAVIHAESDFDPRAVSRDGAIGLMQLMPRTARSMGVRDPFDPRDNILGGARFLRILANQWRGDMVLTVASYNAGPGAVERHGGVPPFAETRAYVHRVLALYREYSGW